MPEAAQVSEQADRAGRAPSGPLRDELADALGEVAGGVAEVVGAAEPGERGVAGRAEQPAAERPRQLVQVEVGHEQAVAELVAHRPAEPAVTDGALIQGAPHSPTPNGSQAASALRAPSSWKPQPQ